MRGIRQEALGLSNHSGGEASGVPPRPRVDRFMPLTAVRSSVLALPGHGLNHPRRRHGQDKLSLISAYAGQVIGGEKRMREITAYKNTSECQYCLPPAPPVGSSF